MPLHVLGHVEADQLDAQRKPAAWLTSVLPTPVGPLNRNEPIGLRVAGTGARDILIAAASTSIALSWPNTTFFRSRSRRFQRIAVVAGDVLRRIRAILAMISSISRPCRWFFLLRLRQDALCGAGLVDHVDRLVRQMTIVDVARRQFPPQW